MTPEPPAYDKGGIREPLPVPLAWRTPGMPTEIIDLMPEPAPPQPVGTVFVNIAPETIVETPLGPCPVGWLLDAVNALNRRTRPGRRVLLVKDNGVVVYGHLKVHDTDPETGNTSPTFHPGIPGLGAEMQDFINATGRTERVLTRDQLNQALR